jgi:hypothetical protein
MCEFFKINRWVLDVPSTLFMMYNSHSPLVATDISRLLDRSTSVATKECSGVKNAKRTQLQKLQTQNYSWDKYQSHIGPTIEKVEDMSRHVKRLPSTSTITFSINIQNRILTDIQNKNPILDAPLSLTWNLTRGIRKVTQPQKSKHYTQLGAMPHCMQNAPDNESKLTECHYSGLWTNWTADELGRYWINGIPFASGFFLKRFILSPPFVLNWL